MSGKTRNIYSVLGEHFRTTSDQTTEMVIGESYYIGLIYIYIYIYKFKVQKRCPATARGGPRGSG